MSTPAWKKVGNIKGPPGRDGDGSGIPQEDADLRYLQLTGGTVTGQLTVQQALQTLGNFTAVNMTANTCTIQAAPTVPTDGANKAYVDSKAGLSQSAADALYLKLTGGTVTGPLALTAALTLAGPPTVALNPSTKGYTDARTPPIIVLGPADPVPGGTAVGTVIIRKSV